MAKLAVIALLGMLALAAALEAEPQAKKVIKSCVVLLGALGACSLGWCSTTSAAGCCNHIQAAAWPAGAVSSCIESQSAVGIRIRAISLGTLPGILQAFDRLFITVLLVPC